MYRDYFKGITHPKEKLHISTKVNFNGETKENLLGFNLT